MDAKVNDVGNKKRRRREEEGESLQSDAISGSSWSWIVRGVRKWQQCFLLSSPCLDLFQLVSAKISLPFFLSSDVKN
jgi:hypothetical protein